MISAYFSFIVRAFDGDFHAAIVLLVCLIGAIIYLFVVYEICYLWKARAAAQSKNPKRREKVKRSRRQEEMNSSSGQTKPSSVTSQETANILQELVEAMPLEQATSNDEGEDRENDDCGNDELKVGTDVDFNAGVSCDQNRHFTGHRVHLVAELFPQPKTLKKMKETKGGVPESGNCSRRHPPQYHAQPAIGASRMAKMSEMQSYLGAAKAKYKVSVYAWFELLVFAASFLQVPYL